MKKLLALLLTLVMILSLCACGSKSEEGAIGTWVCKYEITEETAVKNYKEVGDTYVETIDIYKGGTGKIVMYNETQDDTQHSSSLSWEINDDVINITYSTALGDTTRGYTYNASSDTLISVDNTKTFNRAS